jgi:hypothetical protein
MSPFAGAKRRALGQNGQQWYSRAKSAVAEYDNLWDRAQHIAPERIRIELASKYRGDPSDRDNVQNMRNTLAYYVSQAESAVPVNYSVFDQNQNQLRVTKLENLNKEFKNDVEFSEKTYGTMNPVEYLESMVEGQTLPSWAIPTAVMAGLAIAGVIIVKLIKK